MAIKHHDIQEMLDYVQGLLDRPSRDIGRTLLGHIFQRLDLIDDEIRVQQPIEYDRNNFIAQSRVLRERARWHLEELERGWRT